MQNKHKYTKYESNMQDLRKQLGSSGFNMGNMQKIKDCVVVYNDTSMLEWQYTCQKLCFLSCNMHREKVLLCMEKQV